MSIKSKVEALITRRDAVLKSFSEEITKLEAYWNDPANPYSDDVRGNALIEGKREVNAKRIEADNTHKQAFKKLISEEIDRIKGMKNNADDFELSLSNALSMINMMGDNINDETAFSLVKPFIGDYRAMHVLRLALNNKHNINGTLSALKVPDEQIKRLNDIDKDYTENLFKSNAYSPILFQYAASQIIGDLDAVENLKGRDIDSDANAGADSLEMAVGGAWLQEP